MTRTNTFQFSVGGPLSIGRMPDDLDQIQYLKAQVKAANADLRKVRKLQQAEYERLGYRVDSNGFRVTGYDVPRERLVVRCRGRLGPNNPYAKRYRKGGDLYRRSSQDIKIEHSKLVDVYIQVKRDYA